MTRFIIAVFFVSTVFAQTAEKKFYEMDNKEIDQVIQEVSKTDLTITDKVNKLSDYFMGTQYNLTCAGDGPYAILEPWPLVNFKETNCMLFCEHVLALSISDNWDNFFNNLQQIRYRDGLIGMKTRNHYTMADWLPQNNWLWMMCLRKLAENSRKRLHVPFRTRLFLKEKG